MVVEQSSAKQQDEQDWVHLARHLALELASSSSPTWTGFHTRWIIIQSRLQQLAQSLHSFSPRGCCTELIQSIVETLKSIHSAQASPPPAGQGKLQAQSNLDSIVARIDSHIAALVTVARGSAVDCDRDLKGLVASLQLDGSVREEALRRLLRRLRHVAGGRSNVAAAVAKLGALPILARIAAASEQLRDEALDALLLALPFATPDEAAFAPLARMVELGTSGSSSDKALLAMRSFVSSSPRAAALAAARPRLVARICSIDITCNAQGVHQCQQATAAQVAAKAAAVPLAVAIVRDHSTAISCKPSSTKGSLKLLRALHLLRSSQRRQKRERLWSVKLFRGRRPLLTAA